MQNCKNTSEQNKEKERILLRFVLFLMTHHSIMGAPNNLEFRLKVGSVLLIIVRSPLSLVDYENRPQFSQFSQFSSIFLAFCLTLCVLGM